MQAYLYHRYYFQWILLRKILSSRHNKFDEFVIYKWRQLLKKNLRKEETRFRFDMLNLKRRDLYIMEITAARKWERINDTIRSIHIIQDNDEIFFHNTKCIYLYMSLQI